MRLMKNWRSSSRVIVRLTTFFVRQCSRRDSGQVEIADARVNSVQIHETVAKLDSVIRLPGNQTEGRLDSIRAHLFRSDYVDVADGVLPRSLGHERYHSHRCQDHYQGQCSCGSSHFGRIQKVSGRVLSPGQMKSDCPPMPLRTKHLAHRAGWVTCFRSEYGRDQPSCGAAGVY
jgi:hypothetical protein